MFTRKHYIAGEVSHSDYYGQFIGSGLTSRIVASIGWERLLKSDDPHLNDIPLSEWDALMGVAFRRGRCVLFQPEGTLYHALREANGSGGVSPSDLICVAKEAARRWIAEHTVTQAEWDAKHSDYKGGTGKVRRMLRLTETGTASVPVRIKG